jgi:putative transcriptional regulator
LTLIPGYLILYVKLALLQGGDKVENRLRELREKRELTQEDLAIQVGVSRQTIISLEKGKYNPSIILAYKLAKVFDLSIEEVFIFNEKGEI